MINDFLIGDFYLILSGKNLMTGLDNPGYSQNREQGTGSCGNIKPKIQRGNI
jgi:hypothetical protein